jgi:hypothetical protein
MAFCYGCSMHETNRWGQAQDATTFALALGTYISLACLLLCTAFCLAVLVNLLKGFVRSHGDALSSSEPPSQPGSDME